MSDKNPFYKILSIDGGGIRGLIAGLILVEIEKRTGKAISELFDLIAGTSTGGILALGLTVPDEKTGKAKYSAEEISKLYQERGNLIFQRNIKGLLGVFEEKYSSQGIETLLEEYFGESELKSALTDLLITSYDFEQMRQPFFFKSRQAKVNPRRNFKMKLIARATSAAPTYFEPFKLTTTRDEYYYSLLDGGIFANNPAMCAFAEAMKSYSPANLLMVSLGTGARTIEIAYEKAIHWGLLEWVRPLIYLMMNGNNETVDYQLKEIFAAREGSTYYRLQIDLPHDPEIQELDNVSPKNIRNLEKLAEELILNENNTLNEICNKLVSSSG
ncbi:patatin [Thioploca ingrica]|uniref:Patatin n=1 Tax=Thioploca ingrica TaxID=40754 RepID=A0A090ADV9_9GAMM|nr:patatin [Thioploca ingrica]